MTDAFQLGVDHAGSFTWRRYVSCDVLFELKHDGFHALAIVEGHRCRLLSRRGHELTKRDVLSEEIAHSVRSHDAVLDGG